MEECECDCKYPWIIYVLRGFRVRSGGNIIYTSKHVKSLSDIVDLVSLSNCIPLYPFAEPSNLRGIRCQKSRSDLNLTSSPE